MSQAPESRLFLDFRLGQRTAIDWREMWGSIHSKLDPLAPLPLFASDEWDAIRHGLEETFGVPVERPYRGRGRYPIPARVIPEDLKYVQVTKQRKNGRVVGVKRTIVHGDPNEVNRILARLGQTINTAYVERQNLHLRTCLRRFTRRSLCFSKDRDYLEQQLHLFQAYHNFLRPHHSLRKRRRGRYPTYTKRTPAMAQGLTDHVWTWGEWLRWRRSQ